MGFLSRGIQNWLLLLIAFGIGDLVFFFTGIDALVFNPDHRGILSILVFFLSGISESEH